MQYTIDIATPIPPNFEPIGYRPVKAGEYFLSGEGRAVTTGIELVSSQMVLRKLWSPPTWMREGIWVAMDSKENWHMFQQMPKLCAEYGVWGETRAFINPALIAWTAPPCVDWTHSLRQITHNKG